MFEINKIGNEMFLKYNTHLSQIVHCSFLKIVYILKTMLQEKLKVFYMTR